MRVYNDRLYILGYTDGTPPFIVSIYNLSGQLINSWNLPDTCDHTNKLALLSDQIIYPDRSNKRLTIYSLDGNIIKHIPLALSNEETTVCTLGTDSVIVTDFVSSKVFRVNISTSEVLWTSESVTSPRGVTSYGEDYVFVWCYKSQHISILNAITGRLLY